MLVEMRIAAIHSVLQSSRFNLPLYLHRIQAGFPSPADDYIDSRLDLNRLMIACPSATFFVRVAGDSMIDAGIFEGDYLVVDRSRTAVHGKIVVAVINGELTVKRFYRWADRVELRPDNDAYPPINIAEDADLYIWGVVTGVVRKTL